VHGQVFPVVGTVCFLHIVENTWIVDLGSAAPLKKTEVKDIARIKEKFSNSYFTRQSNGHSRFEDSKVAIGIPHIVPRIVNLTENLNLAEQLTRFG
jgi:hypothetical protein